MASSGFGSLYVGTSGLKTSSNAINTTANNLANVNTKGYVRQQVLQSDMIYNVMTTTPAISIGKNGLGAQIAEVVHTRDIFLDKYYRTENGRQNFYSAMADALDEAQSIFQELEGQQFQYAMTDLRDAFDELAKDPSDSVNQNLIVQKATLFLSRAKSVQESLENYQSNLNTQVRDMVNRINEIGQRICELNRSISRIEAGKVETSYDLRDERDNLLDELSGYVKVDATEIYDGTVTVKIEGTEFVEGVRYEEIDDYMDEYSGYVIPVWEHLSNYEDKEFKYVCDLGIGFGSERNTDIGELRALLFARGDKQATLLESMADELKALGIDTVSTFCDDSVIMSIENRLDTLVNSMIKNINEIFSPTRELTDATGNPVTSITLADGSVYTNTNGVRIWDSENGAVGSDGKGPGLELFSRAFYDRYAEATDAGGNTVYVYRDENYLDSSSIYTLKNVIINEQLSENGTLLPFQFKNGDVNYDMGSALSLVWTTEMKELGGLSFTDYYNDMVNTVADLGSIYTGLNTTLETTVTALENQRQEVIGVSSDEELSNLIRYQNAYNASSRYINVVSEMIETLVTQLI